MNNAAGKSSSYFIVFVLTGVYSRTNPREAD